MNKLGSASEIGMRVGLGLIMSAFLGAAGLVMGSAPCHAEGFRGARTQVEWLSETESIQPGKPFWTALRMKMDEGWHTYWRNPGDSGIATEIRWDMPEGFKAGEIQWPAPKRIDLEPLAVYAYEGEILLLVQITPPENLVPDETLTLKARVYWLECEVNCIPGDALLSLTLPVRPENPKADPRWAQPFQLARSQLPLIASEWRVSAETGRDYFRLRITQADPKARLGRVSFFPYSDKLIHHPARQTFRASDEGYELFVRRSNLSQGEVPALEGILVSEEGWRGPGSEKVLEVSVPAPSADDSAWRPAEESSFGALWGAFFFAFAGGLLLNLMPCVFPVISLKILHIVENARASRSRRLALGWTFTLGVLVSFWILAGALLFLRAAGQEVGWGFQLQNPAVVLALALLFFVLAINLFGFFEVGLFLTKSGAAVSGRGGFGGVFLNGVLATVVATPCTAPFMGSALGFAMTRSAPEALLVFTGLGLGMASPYLILSAFPQWVQKLPKPGAWMEQLKKILGFFLLVTAFWLAWVFQIQAGSKALAGLVLSAAILFAACFFYGRIQRRAAGSAFWVLVLFFLGAACAALPLSLQKNSEETSIMSEGGWEKFSQARLDALRSAGEPVFIDFTAAWCLTCQVNKKTALNLPEIRALFKKYGITLLKADWTSRDPEITRALAAFGRSSVPLYVLYPRGTDAQAVLLPEILTPSAVARALELNLGRKEVRE